MTKYNQVSIPMYEFGNDGVLLPNLIFHRPWDKLHSRCMEYPFAASKIDNAQVILDVGTAKADKVWLEWLNSLPIEVHGTDYDPLPIGIATDKIVFHQADIRNLSAIATNTFDKILAVSVIEHIGLENPQVNSPTTPMLSTKGDLEAFAELVRVLKSGCEIVMTFPFGRKDVLILDGSARNYSLETIRRFEKYTQPVMMEYYEYQFSRYVGIYPEYSQRNTRYQKIRDVFGSKKEKNASPKIFASVPSLPGAVTWRKVPLEDSKSTQLGHIDGVLCGVWRKK